MTLKVHVVGPDSSVEDMFVRRGFELTEHEYKANILCFTGGADVSPMLYGERTRKETYCSPDRDTREIAVLRRTLWKRELGEQMAVGICRGGQLLNVMAGGSMWQHVDGHTGSHVAHDLVDDREVRVTSTHHQMMRPTRAGRVLMTARQSTRKIAAEETWDYNEKNALWRLSLQDVEAVWYPEHLFLCYQPHPEYGSSKECTDVFFDYINKFYPKQQE